MPALRPTRNAEWTPVGIVLVDSFKRSNPAPRPLDKCEILNIVQKYAIAAQHAIQAGFDMVEIHGGHSYLLDQFLSPLYNKRTDEFGGSYENRARFARLVVEAVRKAVGPWVPISFRISADEFIEGGNTLEDTLKLLEYIEPEVDIINVSAAVNDSIQYQIDKCDMPDAWRVYLAEAVKKKFNKPVIASGNIRNPQIADQVIAEGKTDFIAIGAAHRRSRLARKAQYGRTDVSVSVFPATSAVPITAFQNHSPSVAPSIPTSPAAISIRNSRSPATFTLSSLAAVRLV